MIRNTVSITYLLMLIIGCGDASDKVAKEMDRTGEELSVTVSVVNDSSEMKAEAWNYEEGIQGQALYSPDDNKCEIVTYKPQRLDDEATLTLGHELMHCLYGDYHK